MFGGLNQRGGVALAFIAKHRTFVREDAPSRQTDDDNPQRAEGNRLLAQQFPDLPGHPGESIDRGGGGSDDGPEAARGVIPGPTSTLLADRGCCAN